MPPTTSPPKNWPSNLPYLLQPSYSKSISQSTLLALRTKPTDASISTINSPRGPTTHVLITPITDPSHPAHGQAGLFASRDLPPGSFILQYLGEIHVSIPPPSSSTLDTSSSTTTSDAADTTPQAQPLDPHATSDYDLSLDRDLHVAIDAARMGNEARFINDYRGVGPRPNAEFREVWDEKRKERGMGVFVLPQKGKSGFDKDAGEQQGRKKKKGKGGGGGIKKGEEILVSYGRGFWGGRSEGGG